MHQPRTFTLFDLEVMQDPYTWDHEDPTHPLPKDPILHLGMAEYFAKPRDEWEPADEERMRRTKLEGWRLPTLEEFRLIATVGELGIGEAIFEESDPVWGRARRLYTEYLRITIGPCWWIALPPVEPHFLKSQVDLVYFNLPNKAWQRLHSNAETPGFMRLVRPAR